MKLLLSPHNDDAVLWTSFTILREKPFVITMLDSFKQGNVVIRREEDRSAMAILGVEPMFLGVSDSSPDFAEMERRLSLFDQPEMVYAPCPEPFGNRDHNAIGELAGRIFQNVTYYMTYTQAGKSEGVPVPFEPEWAALKLRSLACYESQICQKNQVEHFMRSQMEYYRP